MVHEGLTIGGVPSDQIAQVWEEVAPLLRPCLHPAEIDETDLYLDLCDKEKQLWVGRRDGKVICAMTTMITKYSQGNVAVIIHVGGEFDEAFRDYLPRLKEWAKANNANALRLIGRVGWARKLKEHFEDNYQVLESKLWV